MSLKIKLPSTNEAGFAFESLTGKIKLLVIVFFIIFIAGSLSLLWKLSSSFMVTEASSGGSLTEGIVGTPRFINPLLATSDVDRDLTYLIYSGLMRLGEDGELIPDLAESFSKSEDGLTYSFILKENLRWPDGTKITTDDIEFTISLAQNSAYKSTKRASWNGVSVQKINEREIKFILKKAYPSFIENTIIGILPKHLWSNVTPETFALQDSNIQAIGSGPYQIKNINKNPSGIPTEYKLVAYSDFALGKPKIDSLNLRFYSNEEELLSAYKRGEIESMSAVSTKTAKELEGSSTKIVKAPLPRFFAVFFNQNKASIFTNKEVREALNLSINRQYVIDNILNGYSVATHGIFPEDIIKNNSQEDDQAHVEEAITLLEKNGWKKNENGIMEKTITDSKTKKKATQILTFSLTTSNVSELKELAEILRLSWEKIGVKVEVQVYEPNDLNQEIIKPRKYDALLFGQVLARDMDPFPFWHSSQRLDPGLNLALYTNSKADKLIEDARQISEIDKKLEKYKQLAEELNNDRPAIFLYSPFFLYVLPTKIQGVELQKITNPTERFSNAHRWYTKTDRIWKIFSSSNNIIK